MGVSSFVLEKYRESQGREPRGGLQASSSPFRTSSLIGKPPLSFLSAPSSYFFDSFITEAAAAA